MPVIVWILLIVGILCTLFPSRITAGFGGNRGAAQGCCSSSAAVSSSSACSP